MIMPVDQQYCLGAMFLVAHLKDSDKSSVMSNELKKGEVLSPITHHRLPF